MTLSVTRICEVTKGPFTGFKVIAMVSNTKGKQKPYFVRLDFGTYSLDSDDMSHNEAMDYFERVFFAMLPKDD